MSKLHAEKLIKKDEPGVTIPKGSFRLRFMKEDVLFKKHFKAILLETPSVSVPIDSLNSAEGNFVVDKVEKGHIEGTFKLDSKVTPKANITKTVGYEAVSAGKEIQPSLQSASLKDVKELQETNNGKLLIGVGSVGEYILRIQQALNQIFKDKPGYKPLKEDKKFGILTKNAVSEFQKAYGLKQGTNGVVGQETIQKLDEWVLMESYKWIPSSVKQSATPATVTTYATAGLKNPLPAQKNPDLKKIKKSLDEMERYEKQTSLERIGNTAFLSAAADLSDMDMGTFALEAQRLKMLKLILGFKYVDSEAEEVLIALIRSTPTQDIFKLVEALNANNHELFKKLESKLQMGNYHEYHMVLRQLMFDAYGPAQTGFQMESLQMGSYFAIPWSDPGFIKSVTNVKIVYNVKQLNNGKISISWSTIDMMGSPTGNVTSIEADPFQMIGLKLKSNEEHLGEKDGAIGRVYVMPAINMLEMSNKQLNQAIGEFFDATMLVTGVGEIAYGTTLLRTLLGTADALFGAGNLVITSYRFDIAKTETGKTFLNLWDTTLQLYAIYGIGRLVVESPQIISRLSESWEKFKPKTKNLNISSEEINRIDKTINSFDEALEQAALETKAMNPKELLALNKAKELIAKLSKIEPQVTKTLTSLAQKNGGKMEGLDFRLKTLASLTRKLITDGINEPMNDVLRYTVILDSDFTNGTKTIIKQLESEGYGTIKIKNTFKADVVYKGINTNVKSPDGSVFEIQYHTSESFNIKQNVNHELYEQYRVLDMNSPEAIQIKDQMIKNSNSVKLPEDVNTIK